jgi:hypothetical protein
LLLRLEPFKLISAVVVIGNFVTDVSGTVSDNAIVSIEQQEAHRTTAI